jgi:hypothetical protein
MKQGTLILQVSIINSLIIMTTLFYKIPPNLPLTKGGIIPSLEKRGKGRFSDKCQFNYETLNSCIPPFGKEGLREIL